MADASDSKSDGGNLVRVQVPPPASDLTYIVGSFLLYSKVLQTFLYNKKRSAKDEHDVQRKTASQSHIGSQSGASPS